MVHEVLQLVLEPEAAGIGIALKATLITLVAIAIKWCDAKIKIILSRPLYTPGTHTNISSTIEHVAAKRTSVAARLHLRNLFLTQSV